MSVIYRPSEPMSCTEAQLLSNWLDWPLGRRYDLAFDPRTCDVRVFEVSGWAVKELELN